MREDQDLQLSALIDGELGPASLPALLDALERDPDLAARWERYHLISAALHGESVRQDVRGISAAVAARLASEPTILAPGATRRPLRMLIAAPLAGAALAAGIAFLAVMAVPTRFDLQSTPPSPISPLTAVASNDPPETPQFSLSHPGQRWHISEPELASKLDRLLVNHQEYAPAAGMKGLLPYATFVGYEAGR